MSGIDAVDNDKDSQLNKLKADKIIKFDTRNGQNNAHQGEVSIDSNQGVQRSTDDSQSVDLVIIPADDQNTAKENRRKKLQRERVRRFREKHGKGKKKNTSQKSQEILDKKRKKSEYAKELNRGLRKKQPSTSTLQEQNVQMILDSDRGRKKLEIERHRRYREKLVLNELNAQLSTLQDETLQNIVDRYERRREKQRERSQRYYEKHKKSKSLSQEDIAQKMLDREKRKRELARERMRRLRERRRENFNKQQKELRQRIYEPQNDTISQVQATKDFEQVKMKFIEEITVGDSTETNTIYIKQEFEDENPLMIPNSAASTNKDSHLPAMENPAVIETVGNNTIIDVKQENTDVLSPTTKQDFVFVACADTIAFNEATIRDSQVPCPYCGKTFQRLNMHKLICEGKFVYFCIFCPTMLKRRCNIKRHVIMKHSREIANASQHLNSVDKVIQEIVAERKSLNITTPEEKNQAIIELKNVNKIAKVQVHKEICIVTENPQELIIPDPIETNQESTIDTQISKDPIAVINQTFEMPTVVQMQNIGVCNATDTRELNLIAETTEQEVIAADSSRKSNFPKVVIERINVPYTVTNMQDQSVTTKNAKDKKVKNVGNKSSKSSPTLNVPFTVTHEKINLPNSNNVHNQDVVFQKRNANIQKCNYVYCNECVYKSTRKISLQNHITRCHGDKLNFKWHKCNRCGKKFQYREHWRDHKAICKERVYYYCLFCPKSLLFENMLKHVLSQHPKEIENKESDEIKNLLVAKKKAIDSSTVNNKKAANAKSKRKITQSYSEYFCDHCNFKALVKRNIFRHIQRNHSAKLNLQSQCSDRKYVTQCYSEYLCDQCNYKAVIKRNLVRHMQRTHFAKLNRQSQCSKLEKSIKENDDNSPHSDECKSGVKYTCIFCPTFYARLRNVKNHILQKHSSELLERPIKDVTEEINSKKTIIYKPIRSKPANIKNPVIDPYKIDASKLEYVPVYCFKCQDVKTSFARRGHRLKNCQDCGTRMIYLCSKCKEMHTIQFHLLANHWKQCTNNNNNSSFVLDKLEIYSCSECSYIGTHKFKFESHIARTKHKTSRMKNVKEGKINQNDDEELEMYKEDLFAIEPCVTDYFTMTRRYCSKCDKVVTEDVQKRKYVTNGNCQVCGTQFHLQCVKCNINYKCHISIRYHLNTKCFPGDYKCIKCDKHTFNWSLMQKHYLNSHTNRKEAFLCEFCSFRSKHRTNFYKHLKTIHPEQSTNMVPLNIQFRNQDIDYACDNCDFTSKRKGCLKVHLQNVHGKKRHKCKICKFKTRYEASLKRHYSIRHKNYY